MRLRAEAMLAQSTPGSPPLATTPPPAVGSRRLSPRCTVATAEARRSARTATLWVGSCDWHSMPALVVGSGCELQTVVLSGGPVRLALDVGAYARRVLLAVGVGPGCWLLFMFGEAGARWRLQLLARGVGAWCGLTRPALVGGPWRWRLPLAPAVGPVERPCCRRRLLACVAPW